MVTTILLALLELGDGGWRRALLCNDAFEQFEKLHRELAPVEMRAHVDRSTCRHPLVKRAVIGEPADGGGEFVRVFGLDADTSVGRLDQGLRPRHDPIRAA